MSALIYYLSSKVRQFLVPLFILALLPLNPVEAAQTPTPAAASSAPVVSPSNVNPSHAPSLPAAQKEAVPTGAAKEEVKQAVSSEETVQGATSEEAVKNALPESKCDSALYLKSFDVSRKRDPFSKMVDGNELEMDTAWLHKDEQINEGADKERKPEDFRFDGRNKPNHASYARLPTIKVTGLMQVNGRRAVSANIQNKGVCILYENDNVVIEANAKTNLSKSLTIKKIHLNGMTVVLDDGNEITGKFY